MNKMTAWWRGIRVVTIFCCMGCIGNSEPPSLDRDQMSRIMADLYIADAAAIGLGGYSHDSLVHVYYSQVFQIHGTTAEEYEQNIRIYTQNPEQMKDILKKTEGFVMPEEKKDTAKILGR